jgi:comEA protein
MGKFSKRGLEVDSVGGGRLFGTKVDLEETAIPVEAFHRIHIHTRAGALLGTGARKEMQMKNLKKAGMCCVLLVLALSFVPALHAEDPVKVSINEATVEQLAEVKFIGPAIAERIVQYRKDSGPFGSLEDLMNVKGIGSKTFEKIKDGLTL